MHLSTTLSYYKDPRIQARIVEAAYSKEVAVRYGAAFGRRPDILAYPADVLEFAKRRATSFHCSEERWANPMALATQMARRDLDALRVGWDLILDIDCPDWPLARMLAQAFVEALHAHGVRAVTAKFSGNKGFHLGVPFEAFPPEFLGRPTAALFPEAPRAIAQYLLADLTGRLVIEGNALTLGGRTRPLAELAQGVGCPVDSLIQLRCARCQALVPPGRRQAVFTCPSCGHNAAADEEYLKCPHCQALMARDPARCACGSADTLPPVLDVKRVIEVDTLLLSVRHLYRMPFSLHEKSGLVSLPIPPEALARFDKSEAGPEKVLLLAAPPTFLDRADAKPGEAAGLLRTAYDHAAPQASGAEAPRPLEIPPEALPQSAFPPCIQTIGRGLEDGKKRALFILVNFLQCAGWSAEAVRDYVREWNAKHPEPLRETLIEGHLRAHARAPPVLPPNCRAYYEELRVCFPDSLCARIRNPIQYAKRRAQAARPQKQPPRPSDTALQPSPTNRTR